MASPALLIVDLQRGFVSDAMRPLTIAIEQLQCRYERVFATQFVNRSYSPFRSFLGLSAFQPGSPETTLAFVPRPSVRLIGKSVYTCVTPAFVSELFAYGIDEIDLVGPDLAGAVTQCAVGLFEAGIRPLVLSDYCAVREAGDDAAAAAVRHHALAVLRRLVGAEQVVAGEPTLPEEREDADVMGRAGRRGALALPRRRQLGNGGLS